MHIKIFQSVVLLCVLFTSALHAGTPETVAQEVLDRLYWTKGDFQVKKPRISIDGANQRVAAYNPFSNTITLDRKVLAICSTFGQDSQSALAYVIGHELVHAFQSKNREKTSFLAHVKSYSADVRVEKEADIQGLFNAQLAGFRAIRVMPDVIEKIYKEYHLENKNIPGYPKLSERQASVQEVVTVVRDLLDVFNSSNYLLVLGKYELAATGFQYILKHYKGYEIYNNLGIAYTLAAQEFWNPDTDKYIYPLEVDWNSKLTKSGRGKSMEPMRFLLLDKAEKQFREAARLRQNYLPAHTNLVCVLNLQGRSVDALKYGELHLSKALHKSKKAKSQELEMAEIAMGVTYALLPGNTRRGDAAAVFQRVSASGHVAPALYAQQNNQILLTGKPETNVLTAFNLPKQFSDMLNMMTYASPRNSKKIHLDPDPENGIDFVSAHQPTQDVFVYLKAPWENQVTLQRFPNINLPQASVLSGDADLSASMYRNILAARDGFFLHAEAESAILKVDAQGRVKELVKYRVH